MTAPPDSQQNDRDDCPACHALPEPCRACAYREAMLNVERAAREVDALLDGQPGAWTLGGQVITDAEYDVSGALLSLHDYLNDVTNALATTGERST